ncbi:MAG TPA: hypothetical protein PLM20_07740 [Syntrophomonadaceae bacterium]|nr:hypothetical protein [Syntrophomonadaceae bacterium]HQA07958.1 hypothetical protein [Syntrophomonadaceae bacterium]HQE23775.1 hypothetical protein [Syntrophomonadaceae bacterium]
MRKQICFTLLLVSLLLVYTSPALGQRVDWNLTWQDDGSIVETVSLEKINLLPDTGEWQSSTDPNGRLILTRQIAGWEEYRKLSDRLPLSIQSRNFLVLQTAVINSEDFAAAPGGLYQQIAAVPDAQLSIKIPGIIRDHSADLIVDSQEAVWKLSRLDHLTTEDLLLKATVFDGLLIAVLLVGGAVIVIGMWFLRGIRRANQLIEEEYSLDNITLEESDEKVTETEEQKN